MIIPVDSSKTPFFRDINIDTHDIHRPGYTKLTSFCDFFGQFNLVKDKTCFTENHCSSIDVMLTYKTRCFQNTSVFETGLSDFHGLVLTLIGMGGGGVFHPPIEVFLAVFFKDTNYVHQTYLTFTKYLFATFSPRNFQTIELTGHVTCPYLEAGSKEIIVFDDFNGKI